HLHRVEPPRTLEPHLFIADRRLLVSGGWLGSPPDDQHPSRIGWGGELLRALDLGPHAAAHAVGLTVELVDAADRLTLLGTVREREVDLLGRLGRVEAEGGVDGAPESHAVTVSLDFQTARPGILSGNGHTVEHDGGHRPGALEARPVIAGIALRSVSTGQQ